MLTALDTRLLVLMRTRGHGPRAEALGRGLAFVGEYGAVWFAIGVAMALIDSGNREAWLVAGALGPVSIGVNYGIKLLVGRQRPVLEGLPPLGGGAVETGAHGVEEPVVEPGEHGGAG